MSVSDVVEAVIRADPGSVMDAVKKTLSEGVSLQEIDSEGIDRGIVEAGKKYESGRLMFPQFMNTVRSAYMAREENDIPRPDLGKAVVAALDIHVEGRNLMATLLGIMGFETQIVEMGMMEDDIVGFCKAPDVTVCCVSGEFASVASKIRKIGEMLVSAGIKDRIVFNAGGATVSEEAALKGGADVFSTSGSEAAFLIKKKVMEKKRT